MDYYQLTQFVSDASHWFLGYPIIDGVKSDPRRFTSSRITDIHGPIDISVRKKGLTVDVNLADYDMPVFSERAISAVYDLLDSDVELISATVEGYHGAFYVVNTLCVLDCIDEERSEFDQWQAEDGLPQKVGQYQIVYKLVIDTSKIQHQHIFRPRGWEVQLLISKVFANRLLEHQLTGARFVEVS